MKKLTPEQLSLHLSHGDWVAMKNKNGLWKVFMYELPGGYFHGTYYGDSIEESIETGLGYREFSKPEITEYYTEYKIIKRPPVLMNEGDKCQIIDSPELREIAEEGGWSEGSISMIGGKVLTIATPNNGNYVIYNKDKSDFYYFPHWAVARDFSEEETVEELTMEEVCKLLGKEVKIKK